MWPVEAVVIKGFFFFVVILGAFVQTASGCTRRRFIE